MALIFAQKNKTINLHYSKVKMLALKFAAKNKTNNLSNFNI